VADALFAQAEHSPELEEDAAALVTAALSGPPTDSNEQSRSRLHVAFWWPWLLLLVTASGGGVTWHGVNRLLGRLRRPTDNSSPAAV